MVNPSVLAGFAVVVSVAALGACGSVPDGTAVAIDPEAMRYFVLGVIAVVGLLLFCLATGVEIPIPWGKLGPIRNPWWRALAGVVALVLVAVSVVSLAQQPPQQQQARGIADGSDTSPPSQPVGGESEVPPPEPPDGPEVTVTDLDAQDQHVAAAIYLIDRDGDAERLGETSEDAPFTLLPEQTQRCVAGVSIEARPHQGHWPRIIDCPIDNDVEIRVTQTPFLENLRRNAAKAKRACRYDLAPLLHNEILGRVSGSEATAAETAIYKLAAMADEMQFDDTQPAVDDKGRISQAFGDAIRAFRRRHGLGDTAVLDYATLAEMSHDPVWPYLRGRPAIPSACG